MSEVTLNILDAGGAIHSNIHCSIAEHVIAALSAEPETIIELQNAVARFVKPAKDFPMFAGFSAGITDERWDSGIMLVDLAARIVAAEWSYSVLAPQGCVHYHNGVESTDIQLAYYVPDDWLFLDSISEYEAVCGGRRAEFAARPPLDVRLVLFGSINEFIVSQCLAAHESKTENPIPEIHARWLMTPREDLRGRSPRDVMLDKYRFIDLELQSRELQWSRLREPAPPLSRDSAAYRFAGFGTHAVVVYYDFVRFLLSECWNRMSTDTGITFSDEVARLDQIKLDWLECPNPDFGDRSPAHILEYERRRIPWLVTAQEAVIDDDCPACHAMAKFGPAFWHLDGCNMDDGFPFSFCLTRDEWEEEERRRKEFDEVLDRRWEQRKEGEEDQL